MRRAGRRRCRRHQGALAVQSCPLSRGGVGPIHLHLHLHVHVDAERGGRPVGTACITGRSEQRVQARGDARGRMLSAPHHRGFPVLSAPTCRLRHGRAQELHAVQRDAAVEIGARRELHLDALNAVRLHRKCLAIVSRTPVREAREQNRGEKERASERRGKKERQQRRGDQRRRHRSMATDQYLQLVDVLRVQGGERAKLALLRRCHRDFNVLCARVRRNADVFVVSVCVCVCV